MSARMRPAAAFLFRSALAAMPLLPLAVTDAAACACCSARGQRYVATDALDSGRLEEIRKLHFGADATLFLGEADPDSVDGIAEPAEHYTLEAAWAGDRLVLTFRDARGHAGALSLVPPRTLSRFEVDTRDGPDRVQGPPLYKEWKFTAVAAASGIFAPGSGSRQFLTLIFHGRGNSCTSAVDFTHWTLVMQGPKANYTLFGDLIPAP